MTVQQRAERLFAVVSRSCRTEGQCGRDEFSAKRCKWTHTRPPRRQALLGLLVDGGRNDEAEALLRRPRARTEPAPTAACDGAGALEVDRGEVGGAINTMVGALPYVQSDPSSMRFWRRCCSVTAGTGMRLGIKYAPRCSPLRATRCGSWGWACPAASNQFADARDAFQRAAASNQLNADLQTFVERQLRELSPRK